MKKLLLFILTTVLLTPYALNSQDSQTFPSDDSSYTQNVKAEDSNALSSTDDSIFSQIQDSLVTIQDTIVDSALTEFDEQGSNEVGSPLTYILLLIWLCIFLLIVFAGLVLCGAVLGLLILLTVAGVVGTSVIVGLYKRSLSKGFSTFVVLVSTVFGAGTSAIIGSIRNHFFEHVELHNNLDAYMGIGGLAGIGLGFAIIKLLKKLFAFLQKKYKQINW